MEWQGYFYCSALAGYLETLNDLGMHPLYVTLHNDIGDLDVALSLAVDIRPLTLFNRRQLLASLHEVISLLSNSNTRSVMVVAECIR